MKRFGIALCAALAVGTAAQAGPFNEGIGSAMIYGPYTGGHNYSYNVAYSYGFAFSSADTWRRDPFAYPGGVYPYRPFGQPIYYRVYPKCENPPISVPAEDGLPILVNPGTGGGASVPVGGEVVSLQPVPVSNGTSATIKIAAPANAEVWVDRVKVAGGVATTPPLQPNRTYVYTVRAAWTQDGRNVEQFRVVGVRAGETAKVDFFTQR
jgi:uncharacterized protein (TIGR03000 family)